jgi:hypothetical protein
VVDQDIKKVKVDFLEEEEVDREERDLVEDCVPIILIDNVLIIRVNMLMP